MWNLIIIMIFTNSDGVSREVRVNEGSYQYKNTCIIESQDHHIDETIQQRALRYSRDDEYFPKVSVKCEK